MTFAAALGWSLVRAFVITLLAWPCCRWIAAWINQDDGPRRPWRLAALMAPFVFPELLVGYGYAWMVAGLPARAEWTCAALMGLRVIPLGVVAQWLTPASPVTQSALYCRSLALRTWSDRREWLRLWFTGPLLRALPAGTLMVLVALQQFELAALLKAASWTDWLFVQQVGGLTLLESLRVSLIPVVVQLGLLLAALFAMQSCRSDPANPSHDRVTPPCGGLAIGVLLLSWFFVVLIPLAGLVLGLPAGLVQLVTQPLRLTGLARELIGGLSMAAIAALAANTVASVAIQACAGRDAAGGVVLTGLALVPGLLGSLILSLALVAFFQLPGLSWAYGTPLPWGLGLTLSLVPRALLLQLWLARGPTSAEFLAAPLFASGDRAQRSAGRALRWQLIGQPRFLAVSALVYWGYLDLTLAYLLAPPGMPSGVVRLYNFMHFGRTAALSAEAAVLLMGPLLLAAVVWFLWWRIRE
ncbi:MAG: hypothetical protein SFV23_08730 [Planctomycetaceae bacterium]|nr:hypothetical protein [Planctomycetaceae bacterium]